MRNNDAVVRLVVMMAVMCRARRLLAPRLVDLWSHGRSLFEGTIQVWCFFEQCVGKRKKTWVAKKGVPDREKFFLCLIHLKDDYQGVHGQPF